MIKGVLRAYREILEIGSKTHPADEDFENMKHTAGRG